MKKIKSIHHESDDKEKEIAMDKLKRSINQKEEDIKNF